MVGDPAKIRKIVKRLNRTLAGENMVDAMASVQTIMANIVSDCSSDFSDARQGLEACQGDMVALIRRRFPGTAPQ